MEYGLYNFFDPKVQTDEPNLVDINGQVRGPWDQPKAEGAEGAGGVKSRILKRFGLQNWKDSFELRYARSCRSRSLRALDRLRYLSSCRSA